jgi:hypothetical protein
MESAINFPLPVTAQILPAWSLSFSPSKKITILPEGMTVAIARRSD